MPPRNDTKRNWIVEFLRDYSNVIPSVIAIMNGLLAVYSTHYPFATPGSKLAFIIIVGLFSSAAISATIYSNHLILAARAKELARILMIRERLGEFLASGQLLMAQCQTENVPPPINETNKWIGSVEEYLINALDTSYVEIFRSSVGITCMLVQPRSATHKQVWQKLFIRLYRLQEFHNKFQ
jgi:hypothetical protein